MFRHPTHNFTSYLGCWIRFTVKVIRGKWTQAFSEARSGAASKSSSRDSTTQRRPSSLPQFHQFTDSHIRRGRDKSFQRLNIFTKLVSGQEFLSVWYYRDKSSIHGWDKDTCGWDIKLRYIHICGWDKYCRYQVEMHKMHTSLLRLSDHTNMPWAGAHTQLIIFKPRTSSSPISVIRVSNGYAEVQVSAPLRTWLKQVHWWLRPWFNTCGNHNAPTYSVLQVGNPIRFSQLATLVRFPIVPVGEPGQVLNDRFLVCGTCPGVHLLLLPKVQIFTCFRSMISWPSPL